jgi:hypothetical protein
MIYYSDGSAWQQSSIVPPASLAQGDIIYFNGTSWARLAATTAGYVLTTHGATSNPTFAAPTGITGNVTQSQPTRVLGTVYHNTGTTALFVSVYIYYSTSASGVEFYCDASSSPTTPVAWTEQSDAGAIRETVSFCVPSGSYYEAVTSSGSPTIGKWTEWALS